MALDFDRVLRRIGEFGRYQQLRFVLLNIAVCCLFQYTLYSLIFETYVPDFWCIGYADGNDTIWFTNDTVEIKPAKDQCSVVKQEPGQDDTKSFMCSHWEYDRSEYTETLVTEWDLVCEKSVWITIIMTCSSIAMAVGCQLFALIQDRFGRKIGFFLALIVCIVPGALLPTSTGPLMFTILRSIQANMIISGWSFPYILCLEIVGASKRTFVTSVMVALFATGAASVGLVAWLCTHWVTLQLVSTLPFLVFFFYWPILDESPRWLLTTNQHNELRAVVKKIATVNKVPFKKGELMLYCSTANYAPHQRNLNVQTSSDDMNNVNAIDEPQQDLPSRSYKEILTQTCTDCSNLQCCRKIRKLSESQFESAPAHSSASILDLFRTPNLRLKTMVIAYLFIANAVVYTGLAFNVDNLKGNRFLIFSILMIMEVPAGIMINFTLDRAGRIMPMCAAMILGGIASIATSQLPTDSSAAAVGIMAAVAKFGISGSFAILCQLAGELFPTALRGTGTGFGGFLGNLSTAAIPFIIASASETNKSMPMVVMGLLSVSGGIVVLLLPETLGAIMPETLADCDETSAGLETAWRNVTFQNLREGRETMARRSSMDIRTLAPTDLSKFGLAKGGGSAQGGQVRLLGSKKQPMTDLSKLKPTDLSTLAPTDLSAITSPATDDETQRQSLLKKDERV